MKLTLGSHTATAACWHNHRIGPSFHNKGDLEKVNLDLKSLTVTLVLLLSAAIVLLGVAALSLSPR